MRLALIGYGAMGRLVSNLVTSQGRADNDEIGVTLTSRDASQSVRDLASSLRGHDVAIDFSVGTAVIKHVRACALAAVPLVEGTTGWKEQEAEARQIVNEHNAALVYGANFSIGVNIFYRIVAHATKLMTGIDEY
ncbi:MAG: hypothetical protein M3Y84_13975, partial [Acidobacteriota bacterium]|nr:hypothetical protein [Acidobacteriota bacterium]